MAKSTIDKDLATRANMFMMFPEDLTLILDEKHPLYDPRVKKPLTETFVKNIEKHGVIQPIIVRKVGPEIIVMEGRQRTKAGIAINKGRSNGDRIRIPVIVKRADDASALDISIITNEHRHAEKDIVQKATVANRMMQQFGKTEEDVALTYGVTAVTVRNWLAVLDLPVAARHAISAGRISATDAVKHLANTPADELDAAIEKIASSSSRGDVEAEGADDSTFRAKGEKGEKGESTRKKESAVSRMRRIYRNEEAVKALGKREHALMDWIFGKITNKELTEIIPALTAEHLHK